MKKIILLVIGVALCATSIFAQDELPSVAESPKTEFRAVWLTTVWALDWPSQQGNTDEIAAQQQQQMIEFFDKFKEANINAVFFQVRPMADALYQSSIPEEPWSQFVTGKRGEKPSFDPLDFAITLAHERGLELHAWLNPYRYSSGETSFGKLPTDYSNTHPDWLIVCANGSSILNPGIPEVRERIVEVTMDIIGHYDVDGIVFDDYFYVEGMTDEMDQAQFDTYNPQNLSRGDWRRNNVNKMVAEVYAAIKSFKPWCRFGIGPAGVAASRKDVADKYGIRPCLNVEDDWQYDGIFSEPVAWLMDHSIDYVSPQIYWPIGSSNDFTTISNWWYEVAEKFQRHCYVSHSLSGLGRRFEVDEVPNEVMVNRQANSEAQKKYAPKPTKANPAEKNIETVQTKQSENGKGKKNKTANFVQPKKMNHQPVNKIIARPINTSGSVYFQASRFTSEKFHVAETLKTGVYAYKALPPVLTWFEGERFFAPEKLLYKGSTLYWNECAPRYSVYIFPANLPVKNAMESSRYLAGMVYTNTLDLEDEIVPGFAMQDANGYMVAVCAMDRYGNESAPAIVHL